jgi:hypothetical protein
MFFIHYFAVMLVSCLFRLCESGEQVFAGFKAKRDDLSASDIGIIQFDTRPLTDYWEASARWNKAYAQYHGHKYVYMSMQTECKCGEYLVSPVWCKVKAMVHASDILPRAKAFVFLDSDAVVTSNHSLADIVAYMRHDLQWDLRTRPVAFNQDGPGWSCKHTMELGFNYCFNSGTVFWLNNDAGRNIVREWWNSCADPYESSVFPERWRHRWPWEQAQMYKVYENHREEIQRLSFPNASFLPWTSKNKPKSQYPTDAVEPWCFSHWPGAKCFITHHCASKKQKAKMIDMYQVPWQVSVKTYYID